MVGWEINFLIFKAWRVRTVTDPRSNCDLLMRPCAKLVFLLFLLISCQALLLVCLIFNFYCRETQNCCFIHNLSPPSFELLTIFLLTAFIIFSCRLSAKIGWCKWVISFPSVSLYLLFLFKWWWCLTALWVVVVVVVVVSSLKPREFLVNLQFAERAMVHLVLEGTDS